MKTARQRAGRLAPLFLAALAVSAPGCVTALESDVTANAAPDRDPAYAGPLAKATQTRTMHKNFETRYSLAVTYLSPEFRTAFARRLESVYKQDQALFDEAQTKAGFFVSIDAPSGGSVDLHNPNHWTLLLGDPSGGQAIKPLIVKRLGDKERWRAFFSTVNPWTTEYLVVFDAPSIDPKSPALVEKTGVSLTFANADGSVTLSW